MRFWLLVLQQKMQVVDCNNIPRCYLLVRLICNLGRRYKKPCLMLCRRLLKVFGFAGASAQKDFYAALQSGQITFQDFSKRLIELNKGTNGFAEMARKNSEGIRTSFGNIVNAVAKGIANVIDAFDKMSKAVTGKSIAQNWTH